MSEVGQVIGGRFRLDALLGRGGMGSVFVATDSSIGRQVAIKLLRPEISEDPQSLERLREEARSLAALHHPNIVQLYDCSAVPGSAFLVMEFVRGETLARRLKQRGAMPVAPAVESTRQVLSALAAAHAHGIIHRDIKPANVMVTEVVGQGELVKVLDFGIAKLTEETIRRRPTTAGILIGTPSAMAPEQTAGRPVDVRTDVHASGLLLYTLLAGHNPFHQSDLASTLRAVQEFVPPPLASVRADVPLPISEAVARALAKDPNIRFGSALEFAQALATIGGASQVIAPVAFSPAKSYASEASTLAARVGNTGATVAPRASRGWVVAIVALVALLAVAGGALAIIAMKPFGAVALAVLDASAPAPSTSEPVASSPIASTSASAAPSRGPRRAQPSSTPAPIGSPVAPTPATNTGAPTAAPAGTCRCLVPNGTVALAENQGGNVALGQRRTLLNCECHNPSASLCSTEVRRCAAGTKGCRSDGFTECAARQFRAEKEGLSCSGWTSIGEKLPGTTECEFPFEGNRVAGPEGRPCTGLTVHLKMIPGIVSCP